jgi:hypothetical protein
METEFEKRMGAASAEHWEAVEAANDRLLSAFEEIALELLAGKRRFQALSNEGDLEAGKWYAPALDYLWVEWTHSMTSNDVRVELAEYESEDAGTPNRFIGIATGGEVLRAMGAYGP